MLTLTPATPDEYPFTHDLTRANMEPYVERFWGGWDPDIYRANYDRTENLVVRLGGERVGFVRLCPDGDRLVLEDLQIAPAFQNRGVGTRVLAEVERLAAGRGFRAVRLRCFTVNPAYRFYQRAGFAVVERGEVADWLERPVGGGVRLPAPVAAGRAAAAGAVTAFAAAATLWFLAGTLDALGLSPGRPPDDGFTTAASLAGGLLAGLAAFAARGPRVVPAVEPWARVAARAGLVFVLAVYGVSKLLGAQFRLPYAALDTPLGDATGYALAWRFFGYAYGYEAFVAAGQLAGAALLLAWRTTTLGACVLAVVLANVVAVNLTHDLPVKAFSAGLLALAVYLVAFDLRRLAAVFVANRSAQPQQLPTAGGRWATGWPAAGFGLFALAHAGLYVALLDSVPTPVSGAWEVVSPASPAPGWERVYFEREVNGRYPGSILRGGNRSRFRYHIDPAAGQLTITFAGQVEDGFDGTYTVNRDGTLTLTGHVGEQPVELRLVRRR